MLKWYRQFSNASFQTKSFAFTWAIYLLAIIVTTVYCYARLDFVRSTASKSSTSSSIP